MYTYIYIYIWLSLLGTVIPHGGGVRFELKSESFFFCCRFWSSVPTPSPRPDTDTTSGTLNQPPWTSRLRCLNRKPSILTNRMQLCIHRHSYWLSPLSYDLTFSPSTMWWLRNQQNCNQIYATRGGEALGKANQSTIHNKIWFGNFQNCTGQGPHGQRVNKSFKSGHGDMRTSAKSIQKYPWPGLGRACHSMNLVHKMSRIVQWRFHLATKSIHAAPSSLSFFPRSE